MFLFTRKVPVDTRVATTTTSPRTRETLVMAKISDVPAASRERESMKLDTVSVPSSRGIYRDYFSPSSSSSSSPHFSANRIKRCASIQEGGTNARKMRERVATNKAPRSLPLSPSLFVSVADKFSTASRFVLSQRFIYTKDSSLTLPLSAPRVSPRSSAPPAPFFLIYRPVALHGLASLLASYTPPIHTHAHAYTHTKPLSTFNRESCLSRLA